MRRDSGQYHSDPVGVDSVEVGGGEVELRFKLCNVGLYSANETLTRVNLMHAERSDAETSLLHLAGRRVAGFGGGNTALDAIRTARRLGAVDATIMYRRTDAEMPTRREAVIHATRKGYA